MLLFIAVLKEDFEQYFAFQYISYYSLSIPPTEKHKLSNKFQYISCYSLSFPDRESTIMCLCFNTSHVTLYLSEITLFSKSLARFNPSHVTLYPLPGSITAAIILVSIHLMLLFIWFNRISIYWLMCFNTSHVTLYQKCGRKLTDPESMFQYISCYSLSKYGCPYPIKKRGFQYISCYSLSHAEAIALQHVQSFNTSHVTLYQRSTCLNI